MHQVKSMDDVDRLANGSLVPAALLEAVRDDLIMATSLDPGEQDDPGPCGCRFVILEDEADAVRAGLKGSERRSLEFVEKIPIADSDVNRLVMMWDNGCFAIYYSKPGTLGTEVEEWIHTHMNR